MARLIVTLLVAVLAVIVPLAQCDTQATIDNLSNKLNDGTLAESLPAGIIPPGFNASVPTKDDIVKVLKQKCEKNAGNADEFAKVEEAAGEFSTCVTNLVNLETLQDEIEEAQPKGELDTVFNKYCRKRTIAVECMTNLTVAIEPCLDAQEVTHKKTFVNIFTNLLNFVCHKDGDQIALFIAEKGPECFKDKQEALQQCFNETFSGYTSKNVSLDTLPLLVVGAKECKDMSTLQICVVNELERCEESTPANLVDAMFKFIRNETPCVHITPPSRQTSQRSGAESLSMLPTLGVAAVATIAATFLGSAKCNVV